MGIFCSGDKRLEYTRSIQHRKYFPRTESRVIYDVKLVVFQVTILRTWPFALQNAQKAVHSMEDMLSDPLFSMKMASAETLDFVDICKQT